MKPRIYSTTLLPLGLVFAASPTAQAMAADQQHKQALAAYDPCRRAANWEFAVDAHE